MIKQASTNQIHPITPTYAKQCQAQSRYLPVLIIAAYSHHGWNANYDLCQLGGGGPVTSKSHDEPLCRHRRHRVLSQTKQAVCRILQQFGEVPMSRRITSLLAAAVWLISGNGGQALDSSGLYWYYYSGIFEKIYLSTLFDGPQAMGNVVANCSNTTIDRGTRLFENENNTAILDQLPIDSIATSQLGALRKYKFWPLQCHPIQIVDIKQSWFGLGYPIESP